MIKFDGCCKNLFSLFIGVIRLVSYLSENHLFGRRTLRFVVDAGTGTTAIGLGLAALCLGCVLVCIACHFI